VREVYRKKSLLSTLLIAVLIGSFLLAASSFSMVRAATNVSSTIINQDTTWTQANSPYTLTGPVAVNTGATLTIEPGVTVYFNNYYIQVNGTLIAKGTSSDYIQLTGGGSITFSPNSNGWNEQTESGSIIENANITTTLIVNQVALKIDNNHINYGFSINGGSSLVTNNIMAAISISVNDGSPTFSNNVGPFAISIINASPTLYNNSIDTLYFNLGGGGGGDPIIVNNTIRDLSQVVSGAATLPQIDSATITGNLILSGVSFESASAVVSNNVIESTLHVKEDGGILVISNNTIIAPPTFVQGNIMFQTQDHYATYDGVDVEGSLTSANISDNIIDDSAVGISIAQATIVTIERNAVLNSTGISVNSSGNLTVEHNYVSGSLTANADTAATIQDNTLTNGFGGNVPATSTLTGNNILGGFWWSSSSNINATYNWWGTTDQQAINQTIHDSKNDFNLGTVSFVPFLTAPIPDAPTSPTDIPTKITTSTSTATPTQTENPSASPSDNSTAPSNQSGTKVDANPGIDWMQIALLTTLGVIVALIIVIIALARKKNPKCDSKLGTEPLVE